MKECRSCKLIKPLSEFHKSARLPGGYEPRCRPCRKVDARRYYLVDPFKSLHRTKKSECSRKKIPYNLDPEYLKSIWTGMCPITTIPFTVGNSERGGHFSAHLDRFDPALGYTRGNVVFISGRMNRIKYDATVEELEQLLKWMKQRQESATTIP